jgi:hypothetical protein
MPAGAWPPSSPFLPRWGLVAHGYRLVNFPLRVILALVVIGSFAGVGVWGVIAVLQAKRLTESQRMIGVGIIVVVMALPAAWVIFFWPAYWD